MQYDKSFKEETLKSSDEIGLKAVAAQLGISYYTLSGWRNSRKNTELIYIVAVVINGCLQILQNSVSGNWRRKTQSSNMPMRFCRRYSGSVVKKKSKIFIMN